MKTRLPPPRKEVIVTYWDGTKILSDGSLSETATEDSIDVVVEQSGKMCCFACGEPKDHFDIAHIKPHALGGTDTIPSNLFLLCSTCHADSPDTIYKREFFK